MIDLERLRQATEIMGAIVLLAIFIVGTVGLWRWAFKGSVWRQLVYLLWVLILGTGMIYFFLGA